ncbi:MAG: hypothetical protein GF317_03160 [Candidatus Lokiarchaeota archaeon]|nr:hypothetical protein [Candidatus Lokiarchaeota archaeon]MBD3198907.1 hypothetical protein [Candidatus Lokiarchaeota archaeon]
MTNSKKVPKPKDGLIFIDVHCHLPFPRPRNDRLPSDKEQYETYFNIGGQFLITSSIDIKTLYLTLDFLEKYRKNFGFTCGWAPQTVTYTPKNKYQDVWEKWKEYVTTNPKDFLAIGEIGLDFHHAKTLEKRENQIHVLKKIFELTKSLHKPYVLHVRNAAKNDFDSKHPQHRFNKEDGATKEILRIIEDFDLDPKKIMFHCFSGPEEYGRTLPEKGFTLSVPSSAYGYNRWRKVTKNSPLESLVTETDSYYQHPFKRGPINVPSNVRYSIAAIAYSHKLSQIKVSKQTTKNAIEFFKLIIE